MLRRSLFLLQRRLQGTVTAFKHRRGYGFVLTEGFTGKGDTIAPEAGAEFFFTRHGLGEGFYVSEGERVSFDKQKTTREGKPLEIATRLKHYNAITNEEKDITPIALRGKVVQWDPVDGKGIIVELDLQGKFHEGGPRFSVSLEDMDLTPGSEMYAGRFVRFCCANENIAEGEVPSAHRVILDKANERRYGSYGKPLVSEANPTATDQTRYHGTVRDWKDGKYGFIIDTLSGDSIFFHASHCQTPVEAGEAVTYLLREITVGKHTGKKACFDIRKDQGTGVPTGINSTNNSDHDEDDFDLLD